MSDIRTPTRLFHYSCQDHVAAIRASGELRPHKHPLLPSPLLWLTDLEHPMRNALGLTNHLTGCNRVAHRFVVVTNRAQWWPFYARARVPQSVREVIEGTPGALPTHWWVSFHPIPIELEEGLAS